MPKILIIRFSSIGDIVLTTPVIRNVKLQVPDAEVHYCTRENYQNIVIDNPHVDKVFLLKNSIYDLAKQLRAEKYDYILDLHHNLRTLRLKTLLGVYSPFAKFINTPKCASFNKLNFEKFMYVNFAVNKMPALHIVDRYLATTEMLNVVPDDLGLDYFIPHKDIVEIAWLPETHRKGYAAYTVGAQHNTKKLPFAKMIELCEAINFPIVLLGDKNDAKIGEEIEKHFANTTSNSISQVKIYNACGKFNLNQSASLLQQATVVFAHDTGLMHIAAALQKTVYSIWGNTTPSLGMYPYRTKFIILENKNLDCRPCSKIGFDKCPKGHFKCMNDINFEGINL
jgi:ADP-heptose:LPS heptosyltransferase